MERYLKKQFESENNKMKSPQYYSLRISNKDKREHKFEYDFGIPSICAIDARGHAGPNDTWQYDFLTFETRDMAKKALEACGIKDIQLLPYYTGENSKMKEERYNKIFKEASNQMPIQFKETDFEGLSKETKIFFLKDAVSGGYVAKKHSMSGRLGITFDIFEAWPFKSQMEAQEKANNHDVWRRETDKRYHKVDLTDLLVVPVIKQEKFILS